LLADGAPLVRALHGYPRFAVAGFMAGGRAALDAIERAGCDVIGGAPRPSRGRQVRALGTALAEARGWRAV
jgi:phytoene/squalene synthetase